VTAIEPGRHTQDEPALVPDRPTGLVTFLFTDVEGSTKLWEKYPEAMQRALARHDAIVRHAITSNDGLVFKTIGDAFCAAFSHAPSALLAAVDAQRDLSVEPWGETGPLRARMALHSGRTDEREGDYFGPPVNRVARLLATGHGGQILVSAETRRLLHPEPPGQTDLRDLGQHRLKDLSRPERVFQAVAPGLPHEFKPLRSQPSPIPGVAIAAVTGLVGLGSFRFATRNSSDSLASVFSPLGLYDGFKGLVVELSTENEWLLLGFGVVLLAFTVGLGFARWRRHGASCG
jgi:class 3 adenylate cyclase